MNEKKNIDRLFQERFKDFESAPNDKIWNNIHDALHEKKKKKVIPLWWKLSGIAAGFILTFLAFTPFLSTEKVQNSVVVNPEMPIEKTNTNIKSETKTAVAADEKSILEEENKNIESKNTLFKSKSAKKVTVTKIQKGINNDVKNTAIAKTSSEKAKSINSKNEFLLNENNAIDSTAKELKSENQLTFYNKENSENRDIKKVLNTLKPEKKSIDSTAIAADNNENTIEEFLKTQNEKKNILAEVKVNKWQVSTNVAPVYFNSASNGSPIEAQFEENNKSYENNLSVGVGVQYAVNKKLSLRTGVNKVTLGYGTNDVVFFGGLNPTNFTTLNNQNSGIEIISANNINGLKPFEDNMQNTERGVLNQKMGYIEVPMELSYALIDRKFGINIIGGFSTLFLNENAVSVQSARTNMSLGKADNLNDVHFSSNIGLGLNYKFLNQFEAHFEPTLKYQLNTFSRDAGNFKPYFVGLYTGVSYKF